MAQRNVSYTIPKWVTELTPQPKKYLASILKSVVFAKIKEYEKQSQVFHAKYKISFDQFEKTAIKGKKENFEMWDDYLVWKGLIQAHNKWSKRYRRF